MIRLSQLPNQARRWQVHQLVDWMLDNGLDTILNDRMPFKPYTEYEINFLLDNPHLWDNLKKII